MHALNCASSETNVRGRPRLASAAVRGCRFAAAGCLLCALGLAGGITVAAQSASAVASGAALTRSIAAQLNSATVSAMRLGEVGSYSWDASVTDDARTYLRRGKHLKNGYTWVMLPMIESLARRLGRDAGTEIEAIFGANGGCVIRLGDRWKTIMQLPTRRAAEEARAMMLPLQPIVRTPDMPADEAEFDPLPPVVIITPAFPREEDGNKPPSMARFAPCAPHEELALIVSSWEQLVVEGDTVRGRLSDVGSRLLLCPGPDPEPSPSIAGGEFELTIKDGRVIRYRINLEGLMRVRKKAVLVRQSSDTVIENIGTTKMEVPDEARLKLAGF